MHVTFHFHALPQPPRNLADAQQSVGNPRIELVPVVGRQVGRQFHEQLSGFLVCAVPDNLSPVVAKKLVNLGLPLRKPLVQREVRNPDARANPGVATVDVTPL